MLEKQAIVKAARDQTCLVVSENMAATYLGDGVVAVLTENSMFKVTHVRDYVADDVDYTFDSGIIKGVIRESH